jgi:membrane-bound ClpP family serine protease
MFMLGLVAVGVAVLLLLAEARLTTEGVIAAAAAAVALVSGVALMLIGAAAGIVAVLAVPGGLGLASIGVLALVIRNLGPTRRLPSRSGPEAMIGHVGVIRGNDPSSSVFVDGGLWRVQPGPLEESPLLDGDHVVIERVSGSTLRVRRAEAL